MALRSTWKGYLKLSLVTFPIKAYSAHSGDGSPIRLNQLHAECQSRIKNKKTCPIHGEVPNDQIVSGFEVSKDHYVIIDTDELSKLRTEDTKALTIAEFVRPDAIDPLYWNGSTLYLMPDGPVAQKPYALIRDSMARHNVFAVAEVVWHGKEQLVLIRPIGAVLAMTVLSYEHELSKPATLEPELVPVQEEPEEVKMADMLVAARTAEEFDFAKYKDVYTVKLTELIQLKVEGKEIVQAPAQEATMVINLMDALKKSVEQLRGQQAEAGGVAAPVEAAPASPAEMAPEEPPPVVAPSKKPRGQQRKKKSS
jgi:DNA end-binding protein Ku